MRTTLTNPVYTGRTIWGRTHHQRPIPGHEWITSLRGAHPALVDDDTFARLAATVAAPHSLRPPETAMNRPLQPRPVALSVAQASAFLTRHDRHHAPPHGALFALGLTRGETLIAAAILGRPVPPAPDEPDTIEITRSGCRTDSAHTLGLLYEHAWRRARLRGYRHLITHTPVHARQLTYGLRYVGLAPAVRLPPRAHTHTPWRARTDRGVDGVCRTRWDITRHHSQPRTTPARATPQRHRSPATGTPTSEPSETPAA